LFWVFSWTEENQVIYAKDPEYSGVYTRNWSPIHFSDIYTRHRIPVFGRRISIGDSSSRDQENSHYKYYSDINNWGQQSNQDYHDMNIRKQLSLLEGNQYSTDINTREWMPLNSKHSENQASEPLSKHSAIKTWEQSPIHGNDRYDYGIQRSDLISGQSSDQYYSYINTIPEQRHRQYKNDKPTKDWLPEVNIISNQTSFQDIVVSNKIKMISIF
jgi:hypothetical protein